MLGAICNFNFTILHTKVANNSLIICEHLGGIFERISDHKINFGNLLQLQNMLDVEREVAWFWLLHAILLNIFVASLVLGKWLSYSFHRVERGKFVWENGVKLFHPNWYLVIEQQSSDSFRGQSDGASSRLCRLDDLGVIPSRTGRTLVELPLTAVQLDDWQP